jgi:hypothetical protein
MVPSHPQLCSKFLPQAVGRGSQLPVGFPCPQRPSKKLQYSSAAQGLPLLHVLAPPALELLELATVELVELPVELLLELAALPPLPVVALLPRWLAPPPHAAVRTPSATVVASAVSACLRV